MVQYNFYQEVTVRRFVIVFLFLMITSLPAPAQSAPEILYESVPNLLKLPPHLYLGEACGVAVNSQGHIFVFSRSGHTTPRVWPRWRLSPSHRRRPVRVPL